jgi:hypothetical protein
MFRLITLLLTLLFTSGAYAQSEIPPDSRLKAITSTKAIKIAYRRDARPF